MLALSQKLRALHRWMGLILFPWVIIYGLTGLYMNHGDLILSLFPRDHIEQALVDDQPGLRGDAEQAKDWLRQQPFAPISKSLKDGVYYGHPAWFIALKDNSEIVAFKNSAQYVVRAPYRRTLYAGDGSLLDSKLYWGRILSEFHKRGLVASPFGSFLADAFSIILISFGVSGLAVWGLPKLNRALIRSRGGRTAPRG
jgi:hypothetical protein